MLRRVREARARKVMSLADARRQLKKCHRRMFRTLSRYIDIEVEVIAEISESDYHNIFRIKSHHWRYSGVAGAEAIPDGIFQAKPTER